MEKRWMKIKEVAEYLSIHPQTVYQMLSAHQIPGLKIKGAGWRIDRRKLDEFIEGEMEERERRWKRIFDF